MSNKQERLKETKKKTSKIQIKKMSFQTSKKHTGEVQISQVETSP